MMTIYSLSFTLRLRRQNTTAISRNAIPMRKKTIVWSTKNPPTMKLIPPIVRDIAAILYLVLVDISAPLSLAACKSECTHFLSICQQWLGSTMEHLL
jgi:hypothetical protein